MLADNMDASTAHVQQINTSTDLAVILTTIAVVRSRRDAFEEGLGVTSRRPPGVTEVPGPKSLASGSKTAPTHREACRPVDVAGV